MKRTFIWSCSFYVPLATVVLPCDNVCVISQKSVIFSLIAYGGPYVIAGTIEGHVTVQYPWLLRHSLRSRDAITAGISHISVLTTRSVIIRRMVVAN